MTNSRMSKGSAFDRGPGVTVASPLRIHTRGEARMTFTYLNNRVAAKRRASSAIIARAEHSCYLNFERLKN
jgi:hypothetical protein